jgi:hypothetical protein
MPNPIGNNSLWPSLAYSIVKDAGDGKTPGWPGDIPFHEQHIAVGGLGVKGYFINNNLYL